MSEAKLLIKNELSQTSGNEMQAVISFCFLAIPRKTGRFPGMIRSLPTPSKDWGRGVKSGLGNWARDERQSDQLAAKDCCVGRDITARPAKPESPLGSERFNSRLHDRSRIRIVKRPAGGSDRGQGVVRENKPTKLLKTQGGCPESDKTIPKSGIGWLTIVAERTSVDLS
jgi:hypothetical protein